MAMASPTAASPPTAPAPRPKSASAPSRRAAAVGAAALGAAALAAAARPRRAAAAAARAVGAAAAAALAGAEPAAAHAAAAAGLPAVAAAAAVGPERYYAQREPPDTETDKNLGDPNNPENQVHSYWVKFTILVPNDYSLLEEQTDAAFGHSVFQGVLKDQPKFQDDVVVPDAIEQDYDNENVYGYVLDADDDNHKSDHQDEEMIVGQPENGNGGLVALPKGHGGAPNYPSIWTPGTGALWTKYPPGGAGTELHYAFDWQPSEAERQLMREKLWEVAPDPTRTSEPEGAAGRLAQYIDPRTINRVAKLKLTSPPNSASTDPRYGPPTRPRGIRFRTRSPTTRPSTTIWSRSCSSARPTAPT